MRLLSDFARTLPFPSCFDFLPEGIYAEASNEGRLPKTAWVGEPSLSHPKGEMIAIATTESSEATTTTERGMSCEKGSTTGPAAADVARDDEGRT